MIRQSRREFLEQSMLSAAAAAAASWSTAVGRARAEEASTAGSTSPNETLGVAIIGAGGRGGDTHLPILTRLPGVEVLWIVDPDEKIGQERVKQAAKIQGREPKFARDMRDAYADPAVDFVSIATPHHWHSLAAIWAMQAGKDVYVEKPISHNVSEGRRCVEAAQKYKKICQAGTQCRSMPGIRDAMNYLHQGKLGDVKLARGLCYKERKTIGARGLYEVPESVDYNLWLGPAPVSPLTRKRLHYDWHWQWPYGNGDLGNQGVHQMDIARWGLGEPGISSRVLSYGGRVGYEDAGETPNTQIVMFDYGQKALFFEVRGLPTAAYKKTQARIGVIFEGSDGRSLVIPSYDMGIVYDKDGKEEQRFTGSGRIDEDTRLHFINFVDAVRSRKAADLTANILEGHVSSALCHLGNISYVLGKPATLDGIAKGLPAFAGEAGLETLERTRVHLDENDIDPAIKLQLGAELAFDPNREVFVNDPLADGLLSRERGPFVVPTADKL
ncbi:MAG TPA: Gfo/Idh/MocA family oxidoreductase [Pirellulales bacterium]|jgi:predicted dehydrogenase|nr:Gfo/Idh/MocA family oxidoreductase [Pirellulales bacterium]